MVTRLPRRMSLVEQELFTLQGHLRLLPVFTRSLVVCACFLNVVCHVVSFLLAIVLSVLLRYADSDYQFGIFKLFPHPVFSGVCVTRGLVVYLMLCWSVCICVFFLLNIVLSVDFRLMINTVVSSNVFSYEYLLQCSVIYFVILLCLLKTNADVIIGNLTWIFLMIFNYILSICTRRFYYFWPFLRIIKLCRKL